jgi:RHS repeat-associated protein
MDQLGSAVSYTAPVTSYFPWGETKGTSNPQDSFNFATYWQDSATGLDYANNRYYSNAYGRFMTPDPYQASGGPSHPQSWNRYAYTRGDPVNRFDPSGADDCVAMFADASQPYDPYSSCSGSGYSCPGLDAIMAFEGGPDAATFYAQAAAMGCAQASYTEVAQGGPQPQCEVEVGYSPWVGNFPGSGLVPGKHTFFYVEGPSGWDVVDAGPATLPTVTWVGTGWRKHPVLTGFGNLITNVSPTGLYNENTNPASNIYWESPEPCSVVLQLEADATALNNIVPYTGYWPFGTNWYNSNSFTYTVITELGLPVPAPPVSAPGWGNTIP